MRYLLFFGRNRRHLVAHSIKLETRTFRRIEAPSGTYQFHSKRWLLRRKYKFVANLNRLLLSVVLVAASTTHVFADANGDVKKAMAAFTELKSYHMDMAGASGNSLSADVVNPDRMHEVTPYGEIFLIDHAMYVKLKGTWRKYPSVPTMSELSAIASHRGDWSATDLGQRTVDGASLTPIASRTVKLKKPTCYLSMEVGRLYV